MGRKIGKITAKARNTFFFHIASIPHTHPSSWARTDYILFQQILILPRGQGLNTFFFHQILILPFGQGLNTFFFIKYSSFLVGKDWIHFFFIKYSSFLVGKDWIHFFFIKYSSFLLGKDWIYSFSSSFNLKCANPFCACFCFNRIYVCDSNSGKHRY